jgi:hypothetical protein
MPTLTSLERRLARLEADERGDDGDEESRDWRCRFIEWLHDNFGDEDEAAERELDWVISSFLESMICCGLQYKGWHNRFSTDSRFAADPEFAGLWERWSARCDYLSHEVFMYRLTPEEGSRHCFDFWTVRHDGEQERLRQELVRRMRSILVAEGKIDLHDMLPDEEGKSTWKPTDPCNVGTCEGHHMKEPPSLVYRWKAERGLGIYDSPARVKE